MEPHAPREVLAAVRRMEDELDAARRATRARERELEDLRADVSAEQAAERRQVVEDLERVVELIGAAWRDTRGRVAAVAEELTVLRRIVGGLTEARRPGGDDAELRRMADDLRELRRLMSEVAEVRAMAADVAELRRLPAEVAELRRTAADVAELRRFADEARQSMRNARVEVRLGEPWGSRVAPPAGRNGHDARGSGGG